EILAAPKMTSSLQLKPEGLITFNAILIIDISASMLASDMLCLNIAPAVEGIRASMENEELKKFLTRFKEGVNVPRRLGAAFAALLFLAEKVGRGFGEKVSIIRFADQSEALDFDGPFFDSASGKHGILEQAANQIVEKIGNYKGLATNMAPAFIEAKRILDIFQQIEGEDSKPCMVVLLTDGNPTDQDQFIQVINQHFIGNSNVVLYIVGIGNANVKLMRDVAFRCGGEFFQPDNMGELLIWYSKRARDLIVKLKGGR
ncbi:MAG: vWA domain-containing protein, partial [Candidatus Helarchaeota archaeon]